MIVSKHKKQQKVINIKSKLNTKARFPKAKKSTLSRAKSTK